MIRLLAEYSIKEDTESEVLDAVREFVAAVKQEELQTEYRAFRLAGGSNFLHH
jgi:quinol monooxygenase YgiN